MTAAVSDSTTIAQKALPGDGAKAGWRRALVFGTGFGIAIGERNLEAAIVRARPSGATLVRTATIHDFRNRPAAEWGAELLKFVAAAGETRLAATVSLPRAETIVRTLSLPGVSDKDVANAIELQIETLHPWGDSEVVWAWSRTGNAGQKRDVLVGLARKEALDTYETLFAEAGILLAGATFSPAAIYAALRVWNAPPVSLLTYSLNGARPEVYGESEARSVFSAEYPMPLERALAFARAELRVAPDFPARPLAEALPAPATNAVPESGLAYAAAVAGAAPRAVRIANLLPLERRASHNRVQYVVPAILGILLALALLTVFVVFPAVEKKRYRDDLEKEARRLQPLALRAQTLEKTTAANRNRILLLDQIKGRAQDDLEVLNELTHLLPPQVWTSSVEIYPDSVVLAGEADQAASLLKLLDSSPLFQNSEFGLSVTRTNLSEQFRIKTIRRGRAGRTTP